MVSTGSVQVSEGNDGPREWNTREGLLLSVMGLTAIKVILCLSQCIMQHWLDYGHKVL